MQSWLSKLRTSTSPIPFDRVVALLWSIWKTRNSIVFCNELPQPIVTLIRAKKASAKWRIRRKLTTSIQPPKRPLSSSHTKQLVEIAWEKPPEGFIKVNFDGSKTSQNAAGGYVIRDWSGHLLQAGAFI